MSLAALRRMIAALPETVEGPCYGTPGFRLRRKLFARLREDGVSLAVRVEASERDLLLQADPRCFYITDHYRDHPWVLVRLPLVEADVLADVLERAWCLVAPRQLVAACKQSGASRACRRAAESNFRYRKRSC